MTGHQPASGTAGPGLSQDTLQEAPDSSVAQDSQVTQDSHIAQDSSPAQYAQHQSTRSEPSEHEIRLRAYHRYLERGAFDGADFDDWLQAEMELKKR
jgi:hypothetical protein